MNRNLRNTEQELLGSITGWIGADLGCANLIGDDCAVLGSGLLASIDTLVEGVHFKTGQISFCELGWKAVAVNLSDLAAMAGRPRHLLVSLTLPNNISKDNLRELYKGMNDCAGTYRTKIVGGDLVKGRELSISIVALGDVHEAGLLRRNGARPGDLVVVTGDFGASAAGLYSLDNQHISSAYCKERHFKPRPRLCESWALVRTIGDRGALMDSSDGLADAVMQIGLASNVEIIIEKTKVPVHQETKEIARQAGVDPLDWALYGGEDFELVACLDEKAYEVLAKDQANNPFKIIGHVNRSVEKESAALININDDLVELDMSRTYQHI